MIKLPTGRFSVREREMLSGSAALPDAFFRSGRLAGVPAGTAGLAALGAALVVVSILFRKQKDDSVW